MRTFLSIGLFLLAGLIAAVLVGFRTEFFHGPLDYDDEQKGLSERIIIKFNHVVAENTPKGLAAEKFAELAKRYTGGKVEIQVFPNGSLYSDADEMDALKRGDIQMVAPAFSDLSQTIPAWLAMDLPFAFADQNAVEEAFSGDIGRMLFDTLEARGMKGLALWSNGFKQVTGPRPLVTPQDFAGLKFRTMPSKAIESQYRLFGAKAYPMPFNDTYRSLEQELVDGQENTISNIYTKRLYQVQKYMTLSNHNYLGYAVIIDKSFWNKLPHDLQLQLGQAMDETTRWMREQSVTMNRDQLEQLRAQSGLQIHELTPQERDVWVRTLEPVYDQFRSAIGPELVGKIKELRDKRP